MASPIVGIGELLWDVFPDGRKVAGGAPFNFAFHCHNLGHETVMVSAVGDDDLGRELRERVRELGLSDEFIQTDPHHPTGMVRVTVDAAGQPSYEIVTDVAWDHIASTPELEALAARCEAVCFGTLAQRWQKPHPKPSDISAIWRFLWAAIKAKGPSEEFDPLAKQRIDGPIEIAPFPLRVCDLNLRHPHVRKQCLFSLSDANWLKVNAEEMRWLADRWVGDRPAETTTPQRFASRYNNGPFHQLVPPQLVIVTDGANGVTIVTGDEVIREPGVAASVVDTVGAGDAFTAAMVCLTLEGRPLAECARFAVRYAAKVCEHAGGTPRISRTEVERAAFGTP